MSLADPTVEHLKLLQSVVNRLGGNSFLVRNWSVTVLTALLALSASTHIPSIAVLAVIPAILFAALDAYYLYQERLFRELYNAVATGQGGLAPFSMDTAWAREHVKYWRSAFSMTFLAFHIAIVAVSLGSAFAVAQVGQAFVKG